MLLAARHAREFAAGLDRAAFEASALHQHAIAQALSNLGEAARKVSPSTRDAHPEIPWPQIVGLRHRIAHDYSRLDPGRIWDVVENHLDPLIAALEPSIPTEDTAST